MDGIRWNTQMIPIPTVDGATRLCIAHANCVSLVIERTDTSSTSSSSEHLTHNHAPRAVQRNTHTHTQHWHTQEFILRRTPCKKKSARKRKYAGDMRRRKNIIWKKKTKQSQNVPLKFHVTYNFRALVANSRCLSSFLLWFRCWCMLFHCYYYYYLDV